MENASVALPTSQHCPPTCNEHASHLDHRPCSGYEFGKRIAPAAPGLAADLTAALVAQASTDALLCCSECPALHVQNALPCTCRMPCPARAVVPAGAGMLLTQACCCAAHHWLLLNLLLGSPVCSPPGCASQSDIFYFLISDAPLSPPAVQTIAGVAFCPIDIVKQRVQTQQVRTSPRADTSNLLLAHAESCCALLLRLAAAPAEVRSAPACMPACWPLSAIQQPHRVASACGDAA